MTSEQRRTSFGLLAAVAVALAGAFALGGCSFGKVTVDKAEYQKVKTVAVVIYTVPEAIEYKDDPREKKKSLLQQVIQAVAKGDGVKAATVSHASFAAALNRQGLPFRVLSADELRSNPGFATINVSSYVQPKDTSQAAASMQMAMKFMGAKEENPDGSAPQGLAQFRLPQDWQGGNPLMGTPDETRYLKDIIKALGVDAALVVADPGYSFVCSSCVGGAGGGSTGSAFMVSMVNPQGKPILAMREWFATSGASATMLAYAVNPLEHETLFKKHGEYMAKVFGDIVKAEVK